MATQSIKRYYQEREKIKQSSEIGTSVEITKLVRRWKRNDPNDTIVAVSSPANDIKISNTEKENIV
jgi:hypothetical protein